MKAVGLFVLKSVGFSVLFWLIGGFMYFGFYSLNQRQQASSASDRNTAMTEKYWSQAEEADALQETTKQQLIQSADMLKKQAELLSRWEKVIEKWEQLPVK